MADGGNDRVTLAVVRNDVLHLTDKMEQWCENSKSQHDRIFDKLEDHERRLVKLERMYWLIGGVAAFMSPVVVWALINLIQSLTA